MIVDSQVKAALRAAAAGDKDRLELKDDGPRGAGRLTCLVRRMKTQLDEGKARVSAEWYAVYYRDGRRTMTKLGIYPDMPVGVARKKFSEEYAPTISRGADPALLGDRAASRQAKKGGTVAEMFAAYVAHLEGKREPRTARFVKLVLLGAKADESIGGIAAKLGANKPIATITSDNIVPVLAEIYGRGAPAQARMVRSYLSAAFNYGLRSRNDYTRKDAHNRRWGITANPVAAIPADTESIRAGQKFLSAKDFRAVWNWLDEYELRSSRANAAKLMMATGQRIEEILRITTTVYEREKAMLCWEKTKNGRAHSVPLCPQAVEILDSMTPNEHGIYFPHRDRTNEPGTYHAVEDAFEKYCSETGAVRFIPRDIRRTWKTLAGAAGISKEMRDRLQNHARASDVSSRHYDRYDYLAERRAAVAQWGAYMAKILDGTLDEESKVADLSAERAARAA